MTDNLPPLIISAEVLYGAACVAFGMRPGAPLWLSWPLRSWNMLMGHPQPVQPRPDYARIARLERELGMGEQEPELPIRHGRTICLTKDCGGDTVELRTWQGAVATRIHHCEAP
ncbi:hypothetical protein AB0C91_09855 [Streptomyces sp. NPDC048674]|uniref:hypothetical protein n=1 Tax=Streptomyces sp. NPDC048674 TaxID=3155491 RepID=UPI0034232C52